MPFSLQHLTMFKRKQDVDKHIASILSRKRDEKEKYNDANFNCHYKHLLMQRDAENVQSRQAQGFQIARLYYDIKEYAIAKRYLSGFLHVRENVPTAHQLMGEINEALGEKEEAIENYKRALNLGSYGSSNKQLVLKICELYCEQGTDIERMKYWCDQCEKLYPKNDVVFRLKAQIAEASNGQNVENSKEMENLVVSELITHPTDLKLRMKLLNLYMDSERYEEAYDAAISTDLTTAFIDRLPWFEYLQTVFQVYGDKFPDSKTDLHYNQHNLHILRNLTYLSMGSREVDECVQKLRRFDEQLKIAVSMPCQEEEWLALLKEMKGQMFFLAGLVLLKRAQTGTIGWQEVNQLCGACFLASRSIDPLDPQAPWFVRSPQTVAKFNNWWYLQSCDRLSQVGHMLLQLSQNDVYDWSRDVRQSIMTAKGHQRVFTVLYAPQDMKSQGEHSYFYQAKEMVESSDFKEPITERQMIDIDRVAYQVHLSSLAHLVWLCLQRYSYDKNTQPNYHFNILENIQFSTKNMDSGAAESLCQLDILVFLLATVQCAACAVAEKSTGYEEKKGRPSLLPVCLSRPLCTHDQEEWWTAAYKFCTNTVKDDFSRLRRVLIRGIETVRLIGPHGVSVSMITHIARSLDAKAKSLRQAEHGSRCPVNDLIALESRAVFYWEKAKQALQKLQRNHHSPVPKNRLFKETGDTDLPPRLVDKYLAEATFALSFASMKDGQYETALEGFEGHRSVWAKFYCAQIYRILAEKESANETEAEVDKRQTLVFKARNYLFEVMDMIDGDKGHELNVLVSRELEDLESKIHDLELSNARVSMFHTPARSPAPRKSSSSINGVGFSTPRNPLISSLSRTSNGLGDEENIAELNNSIRDNSLADDGHSRLRPSPERLDFQIKSLSYSQASLFKMVMDRNEELIMINGKMMEELRDNNNQLKSVLSENKGLMEELKTFLGENRDMMKQIKTELTSLKPNLIPAAPAQVSPATPLFMPHIAGPAAPRGPFSGFPPQPPVMPMGYGNYAMNSSVPAQPSAATPQYCPSGLPGMKSSNVGKYRPQSEDDDEEEEDLSNIDEASAMYREYLDAEQSFAQYYTPDSQMLDLSHSARSGMENQPSLSIPTFQPRMSIPAGYFASALRGQTLQYSSTSQTPIQVKPTTPGPGFFSTPPTSAVSQLGPLTPAGVRMPHFGTAGPLLNVATPTVPADSCQSPALMAALQGQQRSIATGTAKPDVVTPTTASQGPTASGIQSFFHGRAVLEPKKLKGDVTILVDTNTNRATILMMGETKDILFHHDVGGLKMEPSFQPTIVIWTGVKIGSVDQERVVISFESAALATQLKEAMQKTIALIQTKASPQQTPPAAAPKLFGNLTSTSTPVTAVAAKTSLFGLPAGKEPGKFAFGGITFSSAPTIETTAEKDRAKIETHKQPPAGSKSEASKPFAGFSLNTSPGTAKPDLKFPQQSTLVKNTVSSTDKTLSPLTDQKPQNIVSLSPRVIPRSSVSGEDEHVEEYEPNVDFKPVISLPELVEKKTGEENETEIFVERCRLFRFDPEAKQWKERGVGEMKILRSKDQVRFRIVMRRDQILKLCANHFLSPDMKLTPMASSDRAWCYFASDFSEEEIKHEQLAVKFKTAEKASTFQEKFNECCRLLREESAAMADSTDGATKPSSKTTKLTAIEAQKIQAAGSDIGGPGSSNRSSLSSMFKPKAGSWECSGCLLRNNEDVLKCPACTTAKPGAKPAAVTAPSLSEMFKPKAGSWECEGCLVRNNQDLITCPACGKSKPGSEPAASLSQMFKPKAGSWECNSCLVRNNEGVVKCLACGSLNPGAKSDNVSKDKPSSGFSFSTKTAAGPPETGFKFGAAAASSSAQPTTGGFTFKSPAVTTSGAASFTFGSVTSAPSVSSPASGFVFKAPGVTSTNATATSATSASTSMPTSGFIFKPTSTAVTSSATPAPVATTGSLFKTASLGTKPGFTIGASTPAALSPTAFAANSSTAVTPSSGFNFGPAFNLSSVGKSSGSSTPGSGGLLAKLLTSDESLSEEIAGLKPKTTAAAGFSFSMPPKPTTAFGGADATTTTPQSKGFQFSFTKTPPKSQSTALVPGSPEVDERGLYVNKEGDDSHIHFEPVVNLPEKIEVKTGEEDEDILFESRGKLYRFVQGEWKEKGVGVVKILQHRATKKTRILMRRDQVLKICCNHNIEPALSLQLMAKSEGKAWVWYALDFSEDEGKMEQLAIRFRTTDTAAEFKRVFDQCKDIACTSPPRVEPPSHQGQGDIPLAKKELFNDTHEADSSVIDDEVVCVGEDKPTADQVARARKYLLPDHFYLYENKPPCPGCIGCEDGELPTGVTPPRKPAGKEVVVEASKETAEGSCKVKVAQNIPVFGGASSLPDFASLTSDVPSDKGFVFGSGIDVDFSSLAESGKCSDFSWNKATSSTPFKFAGAGQKLFGGATVGGGGDADEAEGDDSGVVQGDDIHFEPIIPLPDLVKVKTGEEDWKPLFCQRAKLYLFDKGLSQWKERGLGDIKILSHNTKPMFRILQRREQVLKVSCNHLISTDMELKPMATSETSWCWVANDLTEVEPSVEQFAVKFKTKETAMEFKTIFETCQEKLKLIKSDQTRSQHQQDSSHEQQQDSSTEQHQENAAYKDDGDDDEEGEDDEYEDENVLCEKRATLSVLEDGKWKKLGVGSLQVIYDEDLNGNSVKFFADDGHVKCRHVICREHAITLDQRSCEWRPIDYATDEPVRKHFQASFSSAAAAEEFANTFNEGQRLAVDSELSETLPNEMDVPVIFSTGESGHKG